MCVCVFVKRRVNSKGQYKMFRGNISFFFSFFLIYKNKKKTKEI